MTDTALAPAEDSPIAVYLDSIKPKLEEAATRHMDPDRLIRVFLGLAARNPELLRCTRASILNAMSLCNQTGLEPGGVLGHAWLIPRKNKHNANKLEINFQMGYKGYAELARRSGQVARVNASAVYQWELDRDLFHVSIEPPDIRHDWVPDPDENDPNTIVGAYAVAVLTDGSRFQVWLSRADIEKRRAVGASTGGIWKKWPAEMCRKTALMALLSGGLVPISMELATALGGDADNWATGEVEHAPRMTRAQRNLGAFGAAIKPPAAPEPEDQPIDTTAEPVESTEEWDKAEIIAKDYDPTAAQCKAAAGACSLVWDHRTTWDRAQCDAWLNQLEIEVGVK